MHVHTLTHGYYQLVKDSVCRYISVSSVEVSRCWHRLDDEFSKIPRVHPQRNCLAALLCDRECASFGSIQFSIFKYFSVINLNFCIRSLTKYNIFGCSIYHLYPQMPNSVPTVGQCNVLLLRWKPDPSSLRWLLLQISVSS